MSRRRYSINRAEISGKAQVSVVQVSQIGRLAEESPHCGLLPEAIRPSLKIINDDNNKFYLLVAQL